MAAAANNDVLVLMLWLGLAAFLFTQVEAPDQARPPPVEEMAPVAEPNPKAEAPKPEPLDAPNLRTVSLPPPPSPPEPATIQEHQTKPAAPTAAPTPPPPAPKPQPEPAEPAARPQKLVRALKPPLTAAPRMETKAIVPLRPVEDRKIEERTPEETLTPEPLPAPLAPGPATIEPLKPEEPVIPETRVAQETDPPGETAKERQPKPNEQPSPETEDAVTVGLAEAKEGRTLLRLLEHGSGPEIELAWPDSPSERERLYGRLHECFGMQIAVMDSSGRLFRTQDGALSPWIPNLDFYSGFMRSPSGRLAAEEEALWRVARGRVPSPGPVRLFPRQVDAVLLGGLRALIGPSYAKLQAIHGRYRIRGARVLIEGMEGDGRRFSGTIDLSAAAVRRCSHVAS